jgi:hypothetical protein
MVGDNWQTWWTMGIYCFISFIIFMEKSVRNPNFDDGFLWGFFAGFWPFAIIFWAIEKGYNFIRKFVIFVYHKIRNKHGK